MKRVYAQVIKELRQFLRDRQTVGLAFVLPLVTLLMFGYSLRLESKDISVAVINFDVGKLSREYISTLFANEQIVLARAAGSNPLIPLDQGQARACLVIPPEFSRHLQQKLPAHVQLVIDGSDVNNARVVKGGFIGTTNFFVHLNQLSQERQLIYPQLRLWFNPGRKESLFLVPGALGLITWIFPSLLSALSLSREKEEGTVLQLYASSLTSNELVAGKSLAYLIVGLAETLFLLIVSFVLFGTRFAGNPLLYVVITVLYVFAAVLFGQVAAARTSTQIAAVQLVSTVGFTTAFLLSGFIYPVRNISFPFNYVSICVPARYYIEACRDAFLRGGDLFAHWWIPPILSFFCLAFFAIASRLLYRMQLEG